MRSITRELAEELLVTAFVVPVTLTLWKNPMTVTIALIAGSAGMFVLWHRAEDFIAFVTAFGIGFFADYMCTKADFYVFNAADMASLPSWGPICWGFICVLFMRGAGTLYRILHEVPPFSHDRFRKILLIVIEIAIVFYFWKTVIHVSRYLAATVGVVLILGARVWNTERDLCAFLVTGLSGVVAEASAIHLGIWTYPERSYFYTEPFRLPISIPLVYGAIGVVVYRASTLAVRWRK